jgi:uncharacterized protein involved in exopolysaccharide biosynthesis
VEVQDVNNDFLNMRAVQQFANGQGFNAMMDIQTQIKILQSDSLLERVTNKLKVVKPGQIEQEGDRVSAWRRALNLPEEESDDTHAAALRMAKNNLKVRASGQTRIVEVLVESTGRATGERLREHADQRVYQSRTWKRGGSRRRRRANGCRGSWTR